MFRTVPVSIIRAVYTSLLTACEQDQDGIPSWFCSQAVSKPVWHIPLLCVQWKTPVDGQRNCPKHTEFYSKNKFWEIRASSWFYYKDLSRCTVIWTSLYHDARSPERQIRCASRKCKSLNAFTYSGSACCPLNMKFPEFGPRNYLPSSCKVEGMA